MTKPKPLESLGQLQVVQAKTVNNQTCIEIKSRMLFNAALFQRLGKMMNGSVVLTFDPSQLDAFPDATSEPPDED